MLETTLLVGGTIIFVLLAWGMYGRRGTLRHFYGITAVIVLFVLIWLSMALVRP